MQPESHTRQSVEGALGQSAVQLQDIRRGHGDALQEDVGAVREGREARPHSRHRQSGQSEGGGDDFLIFLLSTLTTATTKIAKKK